MGSIGVPDLVPSAGMPLPDIDPAEVLEEAKEEGEYDLATAVAGAQATGATASGELVTGDPIDALAAKVAEVDGREAIILTEEHFVAELLRLDWTSQARRRHLDVPVLHLMEQETFDEQAGGGEGVTGPVRLAPGAAPRVPSRCVRRHPRRSAPLAVPSSGDGVADAARPVGHVPSPRPATSPTCSRCCRRPRRRTTSCRPVEPVRRSPRSPTDPTRVPVSPDGRTQLSLDRTDAGTPAGRAGGRSRRPRCSRRSSCAAATCT